MTTVNEEILKHALYLNDLGDNPKNKLTILYLNKKLHYNSNYKCYNHFLNKLNKQSNLINFYNLNSFYNINSSNHYEKYLEYRDRFDILPLYKIEPVIHTTNKPEIYDYIALRCLYTAYKLLSYKDMHIFDDSLKWTKYVCTLVVNDVDNIIKIIEKYFNLFFSTCKIKQSKYKYTFELCYRDKKTYIEILNNKSRVPTVMLGSKLCFLFVEDSLNESSFSIKDSKTTKIRHAIKSRFNSINHNINSLEKYKVNSNENFDKYYNYLYNCEIHYLCKTNKPNNFTLFKNYLLRPEFKNSGIIF